MVGADVVGEDVDGVVAVVVGVDVDGEGVVVEPLPVVGAEVVGDCVCGVDVPDPPVVGLAVFWSLPPWVLFWLPSLLGLPSVG